MTEIVEIGGVKITNPDKVLFEEPKITKREVAEYYYKISEKMFPYVDGRLLSIVRCPKGIGEACFYKKHPANDSKGVFNFDLPDGEGGSEQYFYIGEPAGLVSEAQMGTIEFHTWGSRAESVESPDIMVFDLDPDEGMTLERIRKGARDLKEVLDGLALPSFLKTSGGKGYHIVVPLERGMDWEAFRAFSKRVAEVMAKKFPDRFVTNVRKTARKGKIFVDWMRNGRGATSVAPYSLRARKGAPVSMPIAWDELDNFAPDAFRIADALKRKADPWKDFPK